MINLHYGRKRETCKNTIKFNTPHFFSWICGHILVGVTSLSMCVYVDINVCVTGWSEVLIEAGCKAIMGLNLDLIRRVSGLK